MRHNRTLQRVTVKRDEPWAIRERSILVRELEALPGTLRALIATLMPTHSVQADVALAGVIDIDMAQPSLPIEQQQISSQAAKLGR